MTRSIEQRVVEAWLTGLRLDYISRTEQIPIAQVEAIIARAASVPTGKLRIEKS